MHFTLIALFKSIIDLKMAVCQWVHVNICIPVSKNYYSNSYYKVKKELPLANWHDNRMQRSNKCVQSTGVDHRIMLHVVAPVTLCRSCRRKSIRIHLMISNFCLNFFPKKKNTKPNDFIRFFRSLPKINQFICREYKGNSCSFANFLL